MFKTFQLKLPRFLIKPLIWQVYGLKIILCPHKVWGSTSESSGISSSTLDYFFHFIQPSPESLFDWDWHCPFCIPCHILLCVMISWYQFFVYAQKFFFYTRHLSLISFGANFSLSVRTISHHRGPLFFS